MSARAEAVVLGLGQPLAGDDGVGIAVARCLAGRGLVVRESADASVLLSLLEEGRRVVLVDAVVTFGAPGEVLHLRPDMLSSELMPLSSHGIGVQQALELACTLFGDESRQRVEIVGVIIERSAAYGTALSPAVARAIEPAAALAAALAAATYPPVVE